MKRLIEALAAERAALDATDSLRRLETPSGVDVTTNDYLGLAHDAVHGARVQAAVARHLRSDRPLFAPASRLLRGTTQQHLDLEARLAAWKGTERALLFPSGYQANLGLVTGLVDRRDRVISDAANHASLIDGIRLSGAAKDVVPHGDLGALASSLERPWPTGRTWVVVESLYSMDGDIVPLDRIADLAEAHGALLLVDDAHAAGLFGDRGSGLVEHFGITGRVAAVVTTFGKSLAASGACVAGPAAVIEHLINRCRPFIFSTAPPPFLLAAVEVGLDRVDAEPARRRRVLELADRLRTALASHGLSVSSGPGPIVPVVLGANARALAVADCLRRGGFDVRAVRPPTVAPGTARLRLSVHADHRPDMIDRLADAVASAVRETDGERSPGEPSPGAASGGSRERRPGVASRPVVAGTSGQVA